jgi:outer membrane receptor for ferrienterochelin and colicins
MRHPSPTFRSALIVLLLGAGTAKAQSEPEVPADAPTDPAAPAAPEPSEAPAEPPQAPKDEPAPTPVARESAAPSAPAAAAPAAAPTGAPEEDLTEGLDDLSLVDLLQLDLRVATTKTNTTVQASPAAVTVISRADIERFGYRSVAEVLRDVVGTYVVDDHITPNLGVRGVPGAAFEGSGAVKVMIDGVPVSFRTTGENWLGPALVPMASVERIEIVKGPTSSLYGADAFLGVINVITKEGGQKSWGEVGGGGMLSYSGGPGGRVEAAAGLVKRPYRLTLGAQFDQEDRSGLRMPSTSPAPNFANTAGQSSLGQVLRSGVTNFNLSLTPTRKTTYSVAGRYAFQQSAAEFAPWLQFTNVASASTGTWLSLEQGSLTLKAGSSFTREFRLEATATGFFGGTRNDDQVDTGDTMALAHRDLHYFGAEGTVEGIVQPTDGSPVAAAGTAEDFETTLLNVAGRAQLTFDLVPKYLVPTAGVRVDHNSVYGDRASGRVALVSNLFPEFYLKGSYGTAFKAATPLLLYGRPLSIGDVIGSPTLGPQELRSLEFTADYRPKSIVDLEFTVTHWDLLDRAVFRPEQINLIARNAADGQGWTVEGSATTRFSDAVGGSLGFEWVRVTQESGEDGYRGQLFGNTASIYPEFIARGRIWSRVFDAPLEVWLATNVVGPRNASDMNTLEAAQRYVLPTYATLDAGVRTLDLHFFGDNLSEFMLRGQNILDSAGTSAGYFGIDYPAAPPRVQLEFRQEL